MKTRVVIAINTRDLVSIEMLLSHLAILLEHKAKGDERLGLRICADHAREDAIDAKRLANLLNHKLDNPLRIEDAA